MYKTIRLISEMTDQYADSLAGKFLDDSSYDKLIQEDCNVYKPNGEPLIKFRKNVIPAHICKKAFEALHTVPEQYANTNRGMAAGKEIAQSLTSFENRPVAKRAEGSSRFQVYRQDGTVSNTMYAPSAPSGIAGYFERVARYPYCRQTTFPAKHAEKWNAAMPFIQAVSEHFSLVSPLEWANQKAMIDKTHPDFYIHGTVFTTITVNKNWQTAVHKDAGDLKEGFGVMAVLQAGEYDGGYLVFPKYRVAVDMRHGDVLLADVHQWHGNTKIVERTPAYARVSVVFYYRAKMHECGSSQEELLKVKKRVRGTPLHTMKGKK